MAQPQGECRPAISGRSRRFSPTTQHFNLGIALFRFGPCSPPSPHMSKSLNAVLQHLFR